MSTWDRQSRAWPVALIVLAGFALSLLVHYETGTIWKRGYPWNTFLFNPEVHSSDFQDIYEGIKWLDPYAAKSSYPPFAHFPLLVFYPLNRHTSGWLFLIAGGLLCFRILWSSTAYLSRPQRGLVSLILSLFTYPVLFCLDRGNLDILILAYLWFMARYWKRGNLWGASTLLAAAAASKLYPLAFSALFARRSHWRFLGYAGALVVVLTWIGTLPFRGSSVEILERFRATLTAFSADRGGEEVLRYSTNLLAAVRALRPGAWSSPEALRLYTAFGAVAALAMGLWVGLKEKETWKKFGILCIAAILLPQVSYDYKLVLMLVPLGLWLEKPERCRFETAYIWLFGLLLMPKSWYWWPGLVSVAVVLNPLILTILLGVMIAETCLEPKPPLSVKPL